MTYRERELVRECLDLKIYVLEGKIIEIKQRTDKDYKAEKRLAEGILKTEYSLEKFKERDINKTKKEIEKIKELYEKFNTSQNQILVVPKDIKLQLSIQ